MNLEIITPAAATPIIVEVATGIAETTASILAKLAPGTGGAGAIGPEYQADALSGAGLPFSTKITILGTVGLNGEYLQYGEYLGKPVYTKWNLQIVWLGDRWQTISTSSALSGHLASTEDVANPSLVVTWERYDTEDTGGPYLSPVMSQTPGLVASYIGQLYRDKVSGLWYRWNGTAWQEDAGAAVVDAITNGDMSAVTSNAVFNEMAMKAPLESPIFTGTVDAPVLIANSVTANSVTAGTVTTTGDLAVYGDTGINGFLDVDGNIQTVSGQFIGAGTGITGTGAGFTAGAVTTINGRITAGANVTLSGAGTAASPYSIAASGGGSTVTPSDNLGRFRQLISNTPFPKPTIFLFGDSMIGTSSTVMLSSLQSTYGQSGQNMDIALTGSGSAVLNDSCNYWLNGTTYPITASGHTATLGTSGGAFPLLGNVLKLYYVIEPGAGTFQVQISENGGAWTNEGAVVNAAGTLAGGIWTVTKTTIRATYRIQAVWVSGATKIIGGRVEDTTRRGGKFYFVSNGSSGINNTDNAFLNTPAAIVNPIMADIAPNLCILSHLDGAAMVNAYQSGVQNKITTGITSGGGATPSWLIIGPAISGVSEAQDTLNGEQAEAQRVLAVSRFDAFFDNRGWALPWSTAAARGLLDGSGVHYSALAQEQWIPAMITKMGLAQARGLGPSKLDELSIGSRKLTYNTASGTLDVDGSLRIHGASSLILEDRTTPANQNDFGAIYYSNNIINLYASGGDRWSFSGGTGQANFYPTGSTTSTPNGDLGVYANPWRSVFTGSFAPRYVAKTANYTLGVEDYTVEVTTGSPTITLPTAANHNRIYIIINNGAGIVTMATTSSQLINGLAPGTLAAGQSLKIQSTSSNWIVIP